MWPHPLQHFVYSACYPPWARQIERPYANPHTQLMPDVIWKKSNLSLVFILRLLYLLQYYKYGGAQWFRMRTFGFLATFSNHHHTYIFQKLRLSAVQNGVIYLSTPISLGDMLVWTSIISNLATLDDHDLRTSLILEHPEKLPIIYSIMLQIYVMRYINNAWCYYFTWIWKNIHLDTF